MRTLCACLARTPLLPAYTPIDLHLAHIFRISKQFNHYSVKFKRFVALFDQCGLLGIREKRKDDAKCWIDAIMAH